MKKKKQNIDETIYNICSVISGISKLSVEFISINQSCSFQLINSKIPELLTYPRTETLTHIHDTLKNKQTAQLLHHTDRFQLSHISVGFFKDLQYQGTVIVGPFLSAIPDDVFISKIIEKNKLSLSYRLQIQEYYNTLSIFDFNDNKNVGSLIINLVSNSFISGEIIYSQDESIDTNKKESENLKEEELDSEIELRYRVEKGILNAVEKGLKEKALNFESLFHFKAVHRAPNNPLRAYKNLAFSFNTLLRVACERGGVSPVYIHSLSDKFATYIENLSTMTQLDTIGANMISEYCDLVNKYSTAGYSNIIKKAINYINLNFDDQISLNIIANSINVSSSHLSRQFKKETNMTVTEFINNKRVNEAKFLIEQNSNSITEIALIVGFENHNYFCKVFKQITSLTPKEYLRQSFLNHKQ